MRFAFPPYRLYRLSPGVVGNYAPRRKTGKFARSKRDEVIAYESLS
jgi:hypothetical protein